MTDNSAIIAACHRAYTGFEANDPADLIALMTPDVVFDLPTSLPYGGMFHGPEGFKAFYDHIHKYYYSVLNYDLHAVLDAGTHVIVPAVTRGVSHTGHVMVNEHCLMFTVADGWITQARIYADTAKGRDTIAGMKVYPSAANG